MGKDPDQAFLFREAVLDHLVADEKCLNGRFGDLGHRCHSRERRDKGKTVLVFPQRSGAGDLSPGETV